MCSDMVENRGSGEEARRDHDQNTTPGNLRTYLLALLAANDASPIRGRIILVKQVFIIAKEIVPSISEEMRFFPYQWGPYSNILAEETNRLIDEGILLVTKEGRDFVFQLSPAGIRTSKEIVHHLPDDILRNISNMKETTQEVGLRKLLQYIYTHYPQYAIYSKGREVYNNP